jgi:hypothetical protein
VGALFHFFIYLYLIGDVLKPIEILAGAIVGILSGINIRTIAQLFQENGYIKNTSAVVVQIPDGKGRYFISTSVWRERRVMDFGMVFTPVVCFNGIVGQV